MFNKQKHRTLLLLLIITLLLLCSCASPGTQDWSYPLPNDYEIWRINSKSIVIGYKDPNSTGLDTSQGIDEYVFEFCYNERFVCAKQIGVPRESHRPTRGDNPSYYVIDTLNQEVFGPFDSEGLFILELARLRITDLTGWIATVPAPEGAEH